MHRAAGLLIASALAAAALGAPGVAAAAGTPLALSPAETPGLLKAPAASAQARAILLGRTPKRSRAAVRRTPLQASAFRGPALQLVSGVATYRTTGPATLALARWGGTRASIGDGARLRSVRVKGRRQVLGAVRVADALGFVRITTSGTPAAARRTAQAYLTALAARILRLRGRPGEDRVLKGIRPDGSVPPAVALQEFALLYGALPGVPKPAGPASGYGTTAIAMALRDMSSFTPAQQQAINDRIQGAAVVGARRGRRLRAPAPVLTPSVKYQALVDGFVAAYSAQLGMTLPFPVKTYTAKTNLGGAFADAFPTDNALNQKLVSPDQCRVRIFPMGIASKAAFFKLIVAHEVFHCFQFAVTSAWPSLGNWVMEGMADWAALTVVPSTAAVGGGNLATYFSSPSTPVTARSYDAVGFWGAVHQYVPGGLWPRVKPALLAGGGLATFIAAGGDSDAMHQNVASATFRNGLGPSWRQALPLLYLVPGSQVPSVPVPAGGAIQAPALTNGVFLVRPAGGARLVHLTNDTGFLRAGADQDEGDANGRWFCVGGECKCKADEESTMPPFTDAFGGVVLGLNNGSQGAAGDVDVRKPSDFCTKKEKPRQDAPSGPGESNGDPHLTTLDALHYDFQAAGEFTLVRSASGDLEVQARQEEIRPNADLTVDTMIGLRLDGHRLTFTPTKHDPALRVDGKPVAVAPDGVVAVGGGSVRNDFGDLVATWPDGSHAEVHGVGSYGISITLALADARRGKVAGLLGDFDGNPRNDLETRGGKRIPYTTEDAGYGYPERVRPKERNLKSFFDNLYDTVGDSWRITQAQSLMDYGPGQTTKSFTDRSVPKRDVDRSDLSRARRASAEAICRAAGITDPGPLEDCILDVGASGEAAYATAAAEALEAARAPWVHLGGTATVADTPQLVRTPDGTVHVVYEDRTATGERSVQDLRLAPGGTEQPPVLVTSGDVDATATVGPGGGLTAFYDALKGGGIEPSSGIYRVTSAPPYASWAEGLAVTGYGYSYAEEPTGVVLADGTALVASGMAGNGRLFRSGGSVDPAGVPFDADPDCYATSPSLTQDATGAVWAAWYRWDCAQPAGLMTSRVDPATGQLSGPAVLAPGSHWTAPADGSYELGLSDHAQVATAAGQPGGVVAYYARTGANAWQLRLWRIGTPTATVIATEKDEPQSLRLSAEPTSGRLWLAWRRADGRIRVAHTQTGSLAQQGPIAVLDAPRGGVDGGAASFQIAGEDNAATVVFARANGQDGKDGLWRLRLTP